MEPTTSDRTFFWHDYETFGSDPRRDRPAQVAGLRTDWELNPVAEPLVAYCRSAGDALPSPDACLVTGITPQAADARGVSERALAERLAVELERPGTCAVGYNSLRFDDEVTRHLLYRCLQDPYAREWRNGNSRWDLIDVVRMAYALRPEGIEWPRHPDGRPSFRLEDLAAANGLAAGRAHDALADVEATLALARLVRRAQPRLFEYLLSHRDRHSAARLLDPARGEPVLHTSARYPAVWGCTTLVAPVARHPVNRNAVIVFDLRSDPAELAGLDGDAIRERVFTAAADLPEGASRLPLKLVRLNHCPVLAPPKVLDARRARELGLDMDAAMEHLRRLRAIEGLAERVAGVYAPRTHEAPADPELALYEGFIDDPDRRALERLRGLAPEDLARDRSPLGDSRLPELVFRFRARNHPETLTPDEQARWDDWRRRRLTDPEGSASLTLDGFQARVTELRALLAAGEPLPGARTPEAAARILDDLEAYAAGLCRELGLPVPAP